MTVMLFTRPFTGEDQVDLLAVGRAADGLDEDLLILFARQAAGRDDEELAFQSRRALGRIKSSEDIDAYFDSL